jgi:hypothetical protein
MPRKKKPCKVCAKPFEPKRPLQQVCSVGCSYELVMQLKAKQQAKNNAILEEARETTSDLRHKLQTEINKLIRAIDYGQPCISCGRSDKKWHASHYHHKSKNTAFNVTFHSWNLHKSCDFCNLHLHGNITGYNDGLAKRYGEDILNLISDLPIIYKDIKFDKEQLKNAIKEAKALFKTMDKDKVYFVGQQIELRKIVNQKLGLYDI